MERRSGSNNPQLGGLKERYSQGDFTISLTMGSAFLPKALKSLPKVGHTILDSKGGSSNSIRWIGGRQVSGTDG